jgi:RNA polymerase sigma factor (sigma-70 family)
VAAPTPSAAHLASPTSRRLLVRAQQGDAGALAGLVLRYLPGLRRWARRRLPAWVRSTVDTSDLIQDALLRTLSRLDTFQPQGRHALAMYLRTAVRNRIADEHRRAMRWRMAPVKEDAVRCSAPSPLQRVLDAEASQRYRAALAQLSRRDQELIVAHVELDYTHAQLGCMIGRSPNAARMALCRALERLAALMRER